MIESSDDLVSSVQFKNGNFEGALVFIIFMCICFNCEILIVFTLEESGSDDLEDVAWEQKNIEGSTGSTMDVSG